MPKAATDTAVEATDPHLADLLEFLRIPSVSSLTAHAPDVRAAAEWVEARMTKAGVENVAVLETGGHPAVYGDHLHAPDKPTLLIYGHFDVQPVDPVDLWTTPPFEPTIRDDRLYARGASDDKGSMLATILAFESVKAAGRELEFNVKFLFEGQEEIGSPTMAGFLTEQRDRLKCDMIFSSDAGQWSETEPGLLVSLRGLAALQIDVRTATTDLHSGTFGGTVPNACLALVEILASMRGDHGFVAVDGFYDDVVPLTQADRDAIAAMPFDEAEYKAQAGVTALTGESRFTIRERGWARPTLEINGVWGGFQGDGTKTVIPAEAHAKITCRLVARQTPRKIMDVVEEHILRHTPPGVTVTVQKSKSGANPYLVPMDDPGNVLARKLLMELYGKEPYYPRAGGSVPIFDLFLTTLGRHTTCFGFQLDDEHHHAPDEFWRLSSFRRAIEAYELLLGGSKSADGGQA